MPDPDFRPAFTRSTRRVRRTLAVGRALDALSLGAAVAAAVAGGAWGLGVGAVWQAAAASLAAGVVAALVHALRGRWSDADVALYLDARLTHDEVIATALERHGQDDAVAKDVTGRAVRVLSSAEATAVRPRILRRLHAMLPVALAGVIALCLVPPRPGTIAEPEKAAPLVARLEGLTKIEALARLEAPSAEERKRLEALAVAARKLREEAARGIQHREALDQAGQLRERLEAERRSLADAKNRAGLDAAVRALSKHREMEAVARALGKADLVAVDEELEKLAASAEVTSREIARQALDEAARAAAARGASDVARALEEQKRLLQKRAARSEAMEELSRLLGGALPETEGRTLETMDRSSPEAREALARAMVEALKKLDEGDRKRIAESLAKAASGMKSERTMTREEMEKLAKALSSPEGRKALERALAEMAKGARSDEAARAQAMAMAELGLTQTERALRGESRAGPGQSPGKAQGAESDGDPGSGPGGPGAHGGETPKVDGTELPAQARGPAVGGIPLGTEGFSPARPGEAQLAPSPGALEAARPREISAVEGAFVPKEYREQVGRYFAPR